MVARGCSRLAAASVRPRPLDRPVIDAHRPYSGFDPVVRESRARTRHRPPSRESQQGQHQQWPVHSTAPLLIPGSGPSGGRQQSNDMTPTPRLTTGPKLKPSKAPRAAVVSQSKATTGQTSRGPERQPAERQGHREGGEDAPARLQRGNLGEERILHEHVDRSISPKPNIAQKARRTPRKYVPQRSWVRQ